MNTEQKSNDIDQQLPLTEATFLILLSLSTGDKHGYAVMKDVDALSDGRVAMSAGTLYGALGRMLDQGWIERLDDDISDSAKRPKKVYTLSDLGKRILSAETNRLQSLVTAAQAILTGGKA